MRCNAACGSRMDCRVSVVRVVARNRRVKSSEGIRLCYVVIKFSAVHCTVR